MRVARSSERTRSGDRVGRWSSYDCFVVPFIVVPFAPASLRQRLAGAVVLGCALSIRYPRVEISSLEIPRGVSLVAAETDDWRFTSMDRITDRAVGDA